MWEDASGADSVPKYKYLFLGHDVHVNSDLEFRGFRVGKNGVQVGNVLLEHGDACAYIIDLYQKTSQLEVARDFFS